MQPQKSSIYPYHCSCCETPVFLSNKFSAYRHKQQMEKSSSSSNRELLTEKSFMPKISMTLPQKPAGSVASKMNTFLDGIRVAVEKNNNDLETNNMKAYIRNLQLPEGVNEISAQQYCSALKTSMDSVNMEEKSAFNIKCREYQQYVDAGEAEYLQFDRIIKLLSEMQGNDYACTEEDLDELIERSITIACGAKLEKQRRLFLSENRARYVIENNFITAPALPVNRRGRPSPFANLNQPPAQRQRVENNNVQNNNVQNNQNKNASSDVDGQAEGQLTPAQPHQEGYRPNLTRRPSISIIGGI